MQESFWCWLSSDRYMIYQMHPVITRTYEDVPLVEIMYPVFTTKPGERYRRRLRSLVFCLCDVFRELITSPVCWFCTSSLGLVLFQIVSTFNLNWLCYYRLLMEENWQLQCRLLILGLKWYTHVTYSLSLNARDTRQMSVSMWLSVMCLSDCLSVYICLYQIVHAYL